MIQSMTGFGKATGDFKNRKITVEIKSLNSRQLDLFVRIPNLYKEHEMTLRNSLSRTLERGKVDFLIYIENTGTETSNNLNQDMIVAYHKQISESAKQLGVDEPKDWYQVLLRMPDVLKHDAQQVDEEEWGAVLNVVNEAVAQLIEFRKQEGAMLHTMFDEKIKNIANLMVAVAPYEADRIEKVKTRIHEALTKLQEYDYDKNRFEQEMIYHIEKLDVNEEKLRLENHLKYFSETMKGKAGQGKKLGFIIQEIGREINTMGSKSNDADMQQMVVQMKDELEQMKEQVLNVL